MKQLVPVDIPVDGDHVNKLDPALPRGTIPHGARVTGGDIRHIGTAVPADHRTLFHDLSIPPTSGTS
jgi:hypothetical protein